MKRVALAALLVASPAAAQREPGWDLRVAERVELAGGATGPLAVAIAVDRGLSVSRDAPVIIDVQPEAGVTAKKRRLGRGDAVDPEADAPRFAIALRGDAAGEHKVAVRVRFWLCGATSCKPIDVRRSAVAVVSAPPDEKKSERPKP